MVLTALLWQSALIAAVAAAPHRPVAHAPQLEQSTAVVDTSRIRLVLAPQGNEARYRVNEQLARVNLPSDAVGVTTAVQGWLLLERDGRFVTDSSRVVIDLTKITSDSDRRDNYVRRNTLQTDQFPIATLAPREFRGIAFPLPRSGEATFQLVGELTVHGVTRPTVWDVTARFDGDRITGVAKTTVRFADFNMAMPRVASVLSVEDNIRLEYEFNFIRQQGS